MNSLLVGIIVGVMLINLFVLFVYFLYPKVLFFFKLRKAAKEHKLEYKKREQEVKEMLERGEQHDWINMEILDKKRLVCKKTGYCPELKGFVSKNLIEEYQKERDLKDKKQAHFEDYKKELMEEVAEIYDLTPQDIQDIVDSLTSGLLTYGSSIQALEEGSEEELEEDELEFNIKPTGDKKTLH